MRRGFTTVRDRDAEGSERSIELASALAQVADPEFLEAVLHAKSMLDRVGGQVFFAAYRNKYAIQTIRDVDGAIDTERRTLLADRREPGEYETDAYLFHYDHIASAIRGSKKQADDAFPSTDPAGVAVDQEPELIGGADEAAELEAEVEGLEQEAEREALEAELAAAAVETEHETPGNMNVAAAIETGAAEVDDDEPDDIVAAETEELNQQAPTGDAFGG